MIRTHDSYVEEYGYVSIAVKQIPPNLMTMTYSSIKYFSKKNLQ